MTIDTRKVDVAILGGGLAGLSLARHLLLETDKTVLLLERRGELPPPRQKVGESTVQLAGYYFSKVLDLEEHLVSRHTMKYNLRFYWPTPGRPGDAFEDYSQSYIRRVSNIASYQLDRNVFEGELLRLNGENPRFALEAPVTKIETGLSTGGDPHRLIYETGGVRQSVEAGWVVDASGRARLLSRRRRLQRPNPIRHGSFYWWVDGLLDVEKLTGRSRRERRLAPERSELGHLPSWMATNHFVGEGFWFWVIPLQGKTSLGLVYDTEVISHDQVFSVEKARRWISERFPLLARDLATREVTDFGGFRDFSYDCAQTLSRDRWAMTGEAGRFSDPLYSPGSDLIAIHNTLIVDAIETGDEAELAAKARAYEPLMRAVYSAYEPSYTLSYDALGDQEVFSLKYVWELAIYFAFYVFPFINDLFTERRFLATYLRFFSRLGPLNRALQNQLSAYFQWKKEVEVGSESHEPIFFDFTTLVPLAEARKTFFRMGVSVEEARGVLAEQMSSLEELFRFLIARVWAVSAGDPSLVSNRALVESIDLSRPDDLTFDPEEIRRRVEAVTLPAEPYEWSFDPGVLARFDPDPKAAAALVAVA